MMFVGGFVSHTSSMNTTPIASQNTEYIEISNGVFDEVYMDADTSIAPDTEIPEWGYTTVLNAKFKNNILAGNVDFTLASISGMVIKKRKLDDYKWTTIYEFPVRTEDDFDFFFNDIVVASNTTYEYAAVPIVNGVEGSYQIISVDVKFDGCFIVDTTNVYQILLDLSSPSLNRSLKSTVIEPVNSKYPYMYYYSQNRYDKFPVTGTFIELNRTTGEWNVNDAWRYRKALRDFMGNYHTKLVKFYDGRIYLASVDGDIVENVGNHPDLVHTTVNFIEVGDVNDNTDLYYHGFTTFLEGAE